MKVVFNILGSDCIDAIIMFLTVVVTIVIYVTQKRNERRNAARIIVMQIDIINHRVDKLDRTIGLDVSKIDTDKFWQSDNIIETNEWEIYRHLFVKKLDYSEIRSMSTFYSNVISIYDQQQEIKGIIANASKTNAFGEKSEHSDEGRIRVPNLFAMTIRMQYERIVESRLAVPYEKLRKIARM